MLRYYDARTAEYDRTSYELMRRDPDGAADLARLETFLRELPRGATLDVGCGTGWLTRLVRGRVLALDASEAMLNLARRRVPSAVFVCAEVPPLPFLAGSFVRVLAAHFYSHLANEVVRRAFVAEVLRVASELVVIEQPPPGEPAEAWEVRPLADGSSHRVYKRYITAPELAHELGGEITLETSSFVAVRAAGSDGPTPRSRQPVRIRRAIAAARQQGDLSPLTHYDLERSRLMAKHDDVAVLTTLNAQFIEAFRQGSWELLEPVLSPSFAYLDGRSGEVFAHERYVESLRANPVPALTIDQVVVHVDGDTAVVSARTSRQTGTYSRYVDTYERRGDVWKCVHACVWPLAA